MKACPNCRRDSMRIVEDRQFKCEACETVVFHEGNGFVVETPEAD